MDITTYAALDNFDLLANLPENQKLIVDKTNYSFSLDDRWLQFFRRWATDDSHTDIIEPIKLTFDKIKNLKTSGEIKKCLEHIQTVFKNLYPDYDDLHKLLKKLLEDFEPKTYLLDISKYQEKCQILESDFVAIVPASAQLWQNVISVLPRQMWEYAYISPPELDKDTDTVYVRRNCNYSMTTNLIGKVKFINYTSFITSAKDGDYEIRYNGDQNKVLVKFKIEKGVYTELYNFNKVM